ncbi:DUF4190 domain-containing protein [Streptomyces sp. SL13]|uniref:DUF4190 domain-containing protein n=1 Tax=Streptantibioticus silvisoli TaxID=2705255 RepID=A0AA90KCF7_9ACTN|nr:DUF4190 domain-containing protein [Streptantibioticus silvisoli]MDI5967674.1 DUF4190 domain-containing protein [Streptantibioticus silvisoli]MDI5974427.1 DUF4190 domain-containing protein [Streptantibioticus silvisoli]
MSTALTRTPDTRDHTTARATATTTATATPAANARRKDADGAAVASFIIGLLGTVVFNIVFGPLALVLGVVALVRGTRRRGRAALGMALGAIDVGVLAVLISLHQNITWTPGF